MKELEFLEIMGYLADDLVIQAKETPIKQHKLTHPVKLALIAAAIAVLLAMTVSAVYVLHNWDDIFLNRFQPTDTVKTQTDGYLDSPIASAARNGVTLSVEQTITDGNVFYAVVSLRLPEDFDMSQLIVQNENELKAETLKLFSSYDEATGHWYTGPATASALWFQGDVSEEVLETLTMEQVEQDPEAYWGLICSGGSFLPKQVDVANRTAYYLLCTNLDTNDKPVSYTVWFENITLDPEDEPLIEGPIYVTWTPQYDSSAIIEQPITKDGQQLGTMTLSPVSLQMDISSLYDTLDVMPEGDALAELRRIASGVIAVEELDDPLSWEDISDYVHISIQFTDGTEQTLSNAYSSEYDEASDIIHIMVSTEFYASLGHFLDLDTVQSVTVNDVVIPLQ